MTANAIPIAFVLAVSAAALTPPGAPGGEDVLLLGKGYPVEARPSFPGGLYHWIDSLAGSSVGKTKAAHRADYLESHGRPSAEDIEHLNAFRAARLEHMRSHDGRDDGLPVPRASALLGIFCAAETVEAALKRAANDLPPEAYDDLERAVRHFRPRYEAIWRDGEVPKRFLARVRRDPGRDRLSELLTRMARFYGVDVTAAPHPSIALVPVRDGFGTHAEAVGRHLLLEIRPEDDLAGQASVIAHENAHFLWSLLPEERRQRLEAVAKASGPRGERAWAALREALPTAFGQGVADRTFRRDRWTVRSPWYHESEIDAYAKDLYTLAHDALAQNRSLDDEFVRSAVARFPERRGSGGE